MIEIDLLQFERLSSSLEDLRESGLNGREILTFAAELAKNDSENTFGTGTSTDGSSWLESQRAINNGGTTLVETGRLRNSIQIAVDDELANIGTNVEYGKYHQNGTRNLPQRAFLGIEDESVEAVIDRIERMIEDA